MPKVVNLVGRTFGRLKVIAKAETKCTGGKAMYICECDCSGVRITVRGTNLTSGRTNSCGCAKSFGEMNITKTLLDNKKIFAKEYTFPDLQDKGTLRYDFAVMTEENELDYLIEFDGVHHTKATGHGWNTEENFKGVQERDKLKNDYCKQNNIPLIRIPHTERDNITMAMISRGSPYEM